MIWHFRTSLWVASVLAHHTRDVYRTTSTGILDIRAWIFNYIHTKQWDVIAHPCPNFNSGLPRPLKLGHGESGGCDYSSMPWYQLIFVGKLQVIMNEFRTGNARVHVQQLFHPRSQKTTVHLKKWTLGSRFVVFCCGLLSLSFVIYFMITYWLGVISSSQVTLKTWVNISHKCKITVTMTITKLSTT